jgi:hypothetical protein
MIPSKLVQATLQALKCLKYSGEKSFEKLTATLLSELIRMPIRLCTSRYQAGVDALAEFAEIPIAIEDKRYHAGSLDLRELNQITQDWHKESSSRRHCERSEAISPSSL